MKEIREEDCVELLKAAEMEVTPEAIAELKESLEARERGEKGWVVHL